MNLWRLEWLRLTRTARVLILLAVFVSFGVVGPLVVRYLPELLESLTEEADAIPGLPPATPEFAMASFLGYAQQFGILAVAFVGAVALAIDANPQVSAFFRSRSSIGGILAPRFTATAAATVLTFAAGVGTAALTSGILIGWPDASATVVGSSLVSLYFVFVVALIALLGSLVRKVPATALLTTGALILLAIVGGVPRIGPWLPSHLVGGFDALIAGGDFVYWRAIGVTAVTIVGFLAIAVVRLEEREI